MNRKRRLIRRERIKAFRATLASRTSAAGAVPVAAATPDSAPHKA